MTSHKSTDELQKPDTQLILLTGCPLCHFFPVVFGGRNQILLYNFIHKYLNMHLKIKAFKINITTTPLLQKMLSPQYQYLLIINFFNYLINTIVL